MASSQDINDAITQAYAGRTAATTVPAAPGPTSADIDSAVKAAYANLGQEPAAASTAPPKEGLLAGLGHDVAGLPVGLAQAGQAAIQRALPTPWTPQKVSKVQGLESEATKNLIRGGIFAGSMEIGGLGKSAVAPIAERVGPALLRRMLYGGAEGSAGMAAYMGFKEGKPLQGAQLGLALGALTPAAFAGTSAGLRLGKAAILAPFSYVLDKSPALKDALDRWGEGAYATWHNSMTRDEVTLRKFGLDKLADSLTDTRMKATHMAGGWVLDYQKAMAGLTKEERVMVGGVLEGKLDPTEVNGVFPGLQEVLPNVRDSMHRNIVDAATNVRSILDNVGNLFQEHGVPVFDGGSQQLHAFAFRDGFVPHRIVNVAQFLEPGALQNQAVQAVIKAGQASDRAGAISWLSDLAKQAHGDYAELIKTGNAGSQIKARLVGLPGYEQDLDLTMPQYLESSARRIATFAKFGRGPIMPDSPELTGALRDLYPRAFDEVDKMNGPMGRVANDILTTYMGKAKQPSLFMTYIGRPLGGVNVATKMPLAAISRVSHVLWGVARTQYQGALGNMFKVVSGDPETWDFAMKSGAILRGVVKDSQDRLMGGGNLGSQRLNETWFTPVDTAARAFGAVQGATFARIQAKALYKFATEEGVGVENVLNTLKGAHIAERLSKIGINPQEVINQAGHLSEEQTLTAGASIAHDVNFWGDSLSLPGMFRSPEGRFFLQFKTFAAQQGAMVKDNFVKPAMEWVRSNGDRGEIGPLLRAATVAGFGGEAISDIKSMFQLRKRPTDVLERFAEDISNMATLGLYGDAWKAASRGYEGMASFVAGPTVDSLLRLGDATGKAVTGKTPKRFQPLERWAMGNVLPMVHPALAVASRGLESQFLPTKNDQPLGANEGRPTRPVRTARPGRAKR